MGSAPGHKWGQFIGEYCEAALEPQLQDFARKHGLFLDRHGLRPARTGKKLRWVDSYGNGHELDYVLERGGTPQQIGTPVAFIESAWRRYTKHSRNKAQELQGAVLPIADKHHFSAPFLGCILTGHYTQNALTQLRSMGFKVLYITFESTVAAFATVGIDARYDEQTPDAEHEAKMLKWLRLSQKRQKSVWVKLMNQNRQSVDEFMSLLEKAVMRQIKAVRVIPLHGLGRDCGNVADAIAFVSNYDEDAAPGPLVKYEVIIRYDNDDKIEAEFHEKSRTIAFLNAYQGGNWIPAPSDLADDVE